MDLIRIKTNIDFTKYINYIILAYAFFLPISRAGISILTFLMIIMWLIQGDFRRKFDELKNNKVILALVSLIAFGFLSLLWTEPIYLSDGALLITKTLRLVLLPLLVISTSLKAENINKVVTAFLLGMLISEILSYGIFFELWTLRHGSPLDPSPFMHHLDYSTFLTFTSLLLLNRFFNTNIIKLKLFYFIYFLFVTSNLFINGGRTGHFAFAISLFAVGFVNIKNKIIAFISMFILVICIFYAAYNISPVFKQRFDQSSTEITKIKHDKDNKYTGSFGQRLGSWVIAYDMFKDNPMSGTGAASEMYKFKEYVKKAGPEFFIIKNIAHFHNEYVHTLVQLGIIGLLLYLLMWLFLFLMPVNNKSFSNLKVIFISVFCTASLFENIFHNQFPMSLFALFVGIFIMLNINNKGMSSI